MIPRHAGPRPYDPRVLRPPLHADEIPVDANLVRLLVDAQFPEWAPLDLAPFESVGTTNWIYRLGTGLAVRLPRRPGSVASLEREWEWVPKLAPRLPLAIPEPVARGHATEAFPYPWAVYRWLPGASATIATSAPATALARDVARFIEALQGIDASAGPPPDAINSFRGAALAVRDARVRDCIDQLEGVVDGAAVTRAWEAALAASAWRGPLVWLHGDLLPSNLLVEGGRLTGVIDFGTMGVGDPACDLMAAWATFDADARSAFRSEIVADDATWARARGWALSWALIALPYYLDTHQEFVATAQHALTEVLADLE